MRARRPPAARDRRAPTLAAMTIVARTGEATRGLVGGVRGGSDVRRTLRRTGDPHLAPGRVEAAAPAVRRRGDGRSAPPRPSRKGRAPA